eukprot:Selendium_serpulae@DN430_c0_g1_i1.p2
MFNRRPVVEQMGAASFLPIWDMYRLGSPMPVGATNSTCGLRGAVTTGGALGAAERCGVVRAMVVAPLSTVGDPAGVVPVAEVGGATGVDEAFCLVVAAAPAMGGGRTGGGTGTVAPQRMPTANGWSVNTSLVGAERSSAMALLAAAVGAATDVASISVNPSLSGTGSGGAWSTGTTGSSKK